MGSSKICMNASCGATTTPEWKKGWLLRSGGYAHLCYDCGYAYEKLVFCDTFHIEEPGWRQCSFCRKRLHCGCVASKSLIELLDYGGVGCTSCAKVSGLQSPGSFQIKLCGSCDASFRSQKRNFGLHRLPGDISSVNYRIRCFEHNHKSGIFSENCFSKDNISGLWSAPAEHKIDSDCVGKGKVMHFSNIVEAGEPKHTQKGDTTASPGQIKREEITDSITGACTRFSGLTQLSAGSSKFAVADNSGDVLGANDVPPIRPSLSISLSASTGSPDFEQPNRVCIEERELSKAHSPSQQGQKPRYILPKPSKSGNTTASGSNHKSLVHQMRVARPPAEGRGRNQLLPRYWPKITDQELQQLSGDLNSTIVPLFEKVLSASDAGRIGRLVLPKACAEAYFPPISQSEGLPLRIQDVKGKEWTFQFRFWPNNNSRMYVLEGVTPCIQSMQLQAGDTVTFSRIDPGGKLVMGFRKAVNSSNMQDSHTSSIANGVLSRDSNFPADTDNMLNGTNYSGLLQSLKVTKDPHLNALSERLTLSDGNINWHKRANKESLQQPTLIPEKKRSRNISSKSKRLLMHSEDVLQLRLTWEEAQDLLRPPPHVVPSIVMVENHEFEEYDEPPVFGKRTFFTAGLSGEMEQWAQCDSCSKLRRLPADVLLPPKWKCSENLWDSSRCSCSATEEMRLKEFEQLAGVGKDLKRRRISENDKLVQECEPCGLDALATAAILGDNVENSGDTSVGATTKHPRHRSGCTCIVCIQPPSGKGKHKSSCTCNVCMTVKRRFRTLMMRRKIRQSEREAEISQRKPQTLGEAIVGGIRESVALDENSSENERCQSRVQAEEAETSTGQIDLNCDPSREELQREATGMSIVSLVHAASFPLEMYMKQNGLTSLAHEQQTSLESTSMQQAIMDGDDHMTDEGCFGSGVWEPENSEKNGVDEERNESNFE